MWRDSEFGTMPLRFIRLEALIVSKLLDWPYDSRYHELRFCEKTDGNGPLLMNLWLGEVQWWNGEFQSQYSPSPYNVNSWPFFTNYAYYCSSLYDTLSSKTRRWLNIIMMFNNSSNAEVFARRHLSWLCVVWEAYRIYLVEFFYVTS